MSTHSPVLVVLPVVLPLVSAAVLLLIGDSRRRLGSLVNVAATAAGLIVAVALLRADGGVEQTFAYTDRGARYEPVLTAPTVLGGRRYRLEVRVPGEPAVVTAETTVPTSVTMPVNMRAA